MFLPAAIMLSQIVIDGSNLPNCDRATNLPSGPVWRVRASLWSLSTVVHVGHALGGPLTCCHAPYACLCSSLGSRLSRVSDSSTLVESMFIGSVPVGVDLSRLSSLRSLIKSGKRPGGAILCFGGWSSSRAGLSSVVTTATTVESIWLAAKSLREPGVRRSFQR